MLIQMIKRDIIRLNIFFILFSLYNDIFIETDFEIEINGEKKNIKLNDNSINLKFNCISNYTNHLKITSNRTFSQYDKRIGLNRLKKSIIINSITIN